MPPRSRRTGLTSPRWSRPPRPSASGRRPSTLISSPRWTTGPGFDGRLGSPGMSTCGRSRGSPTPTSGGTAFATRRRKGTARPSKNWPTAPRSICNPPAFPSAGGDALGGGLYVGGGTVTINASDLIGNTAQGGDGGRFPGGIGANGGKALGGASGVASGNVTIHNTSVTANVAQGGAADSHKRDGDSLGGGIYIDALALVGLDQFTVQHVKSNKAAHDQNISGPYEEIA